jgi:hypothetical protein
MRDAPVSRPGDGRARNRARPAWRRNPAVLERMEFVHAAWLRRLSARQIAEAWNRLPGVEPVSDDTVRRDLQRSRELRLELLAQRQEEERQASVAEYEALQADQWARLQRIPPGRSPQGAAALAQVILAAQREIDRLLGLGAPPAPAAAVVVPVDAAVVAAVRQAVRQAVNPGPALPPAELALPGGEAGADSGAAEEGA